MTFDDLIGQGHVATTLGNAIAQNRVAHAFLFTGVRGVGKTTSARILAKALNCLTGGPTATPCLTCSACKEIALGTDLDVQEIDGASYNGVDEVRRLQESLPYRPSRDRFKIFIVDEVHMLSQSAWNAFLKTLEEPPPHVKFIFATTEVHKVPITILSRVQRFDFKLIPSRLIIERLRYVLGEEKIAADDDALAIIARQAAGSMRDAMSLLDQVIAWNDTKLTGEGVASVLGVASRKVLYEMAHELAAGNAHKLLSTIEALANQGFELGHVARDFLGLLRDVIVAAHGDGTSDALDLPAEEHADVLALAKHPTDDWLRLYQAFSRGYDDVLRNSQPRAALEMLMVRLARRPALVPIDDLIGRLIRLEKRLAGGSPAPGGAPPQGGPSGNRPNPSGQASGPPPPAPRTRPPSTREAFEPPITVNPPKAEPVPVPKPTPPQPVSVPVPATARSSGTVASAPPPSPNSELPDVERWRRIVDTLRVNDAKLGAFLDHARVHAVNSTRIHVSFERNSVFEGSLEDKQTRAELSQAALALFGTHPELCLEHAGDVPSTTVFELDRQARLAREKEELERARQHPAVQEAIRVLSAKVKHIEIPEA